MVATPKPYEKIMEVWDSLTCLGLYLVLMQFHLLMDTHLL